MSATLMVVAPGNKERLYLGKLLWDDNNQGIGVWYPDRKTEEVAAMALDFMVKNVRTGNLEVLLDTVAYSRYDFSDFRYANVDYGDDAFRGRPKGLG